MQDTTQTTAQAAVATPAAAQAAATFMTVDQARDWAWNNVREYVGTEGWTVMDSVNFHGFFLYGWNYRGQYELQRTATRTAVMQEIQKAAPAAVAVPDGWKLVPTEPTPQMCHVGRYGGCKDAPAYGEKPVEGETAWPFVADHTAEQIYRAMLAAAPALSATPAAAAPVAKADPLDALRWGANVAETLLSIGRAIGFGRAQQILGEQWEAEHNCAPRGRMGVTVKDDAQSATPAAAPVVLPEPDAQAMHAAGIEQVAQMLQKRADAYAEEHLHTDPDTGTTEGSEAHLEYWNWLVELVDDMRALLATATGLPAQAVLDLNALPMPKNPHHPGTAPGEHAAWACGAGAVFGAVQDAIAATPAGQDLEKLKSLSVTNILLDVVPGNDGMGHEVYATSVQDVVEKLSDLGSRLEDYQLGITAAPQAQKGQP